MAAPFFSTPFQPYVYQSQEDTITPFQILGGEAQVVQIMLKPQEKVIAKPGSMCYMSGSIEMDNTYTPEQEVGVVQWILGKSVSSIVLRNTGQNDGFVGIAAPSLARILPPDAFLCSVHDVKVVNTVYQRHRARNIAAAGAERVVVVGGSETKAFWSGSCFYYRWRLWPFKLILLHLLHKVVQKNLEVGEVLTIDVSCIAALTPSINFQIKYNAAPVRRAVFGLDPMMTFRISYGACDLSLWDGHGGGRVRNRGHGDDHAQISCWMIEEER
ncbi:hypothetical protein [Arabidopsis thaliana]|uniref:Uncharacterized protein AT4g17420 n=1 Tax=Arabidopsis thaliana TaxID=3702 RepID=O23585_ARATH|nr:hypothetical protein [Arabidopsis thaliana]CAB78745.1 hypothetical protein [Arabidopsis thaliana]